MEVQEPLQDLACWLQWALSIDDQLRLYDQTYVARRIDDPDGRALLGLRHAWSLFKHHGHRMDNLTFVRPSAGAAFPVTFPVVFREIARKPFAELPAIEGKERKKYTALQEDAYQQHVQGLSVRSGPKQPRRANARVPRFLALEKT